jgi:AcrR family transcriptional regulator
MVAGMADRLGRADWVAAAMRVLAGSGVEAVRVEPLAKRLGVTKGSFYWHFTGRPALLAAVLAEWERRATLAIIAEVEASGGGAGERLLALFRLALGADGRLDRRVRAWAVDDAAAAAVLRRVDRRRVGYLRRLFAALGFPQAQAGARARLAYSALVGGFELGLRTAGGERERAARLYHELLTRMDC